MELFWKTTGWLSMPNDKSLQSDDDETEIKSTRMAGKLCMYAGKLLYSRFDGSISRNI